MKRSILFPLSLSLFTAFAAFAQTAHVDGKTAYDGFVYGRDNSQVIPFKTTFVMKDAGEALEVVLDAENPWMAKVKTDGETDVWSCGDCYELWFDTEAAAKKVVQLAFGVNGRLWDRRGKPEWTADVVRRANGWTATVRIPYAVLGAKKPAKGAHWRFNLCRSFNDESGTLVISSWAHVGATFNRPQKFADLYFGSEAEVAAVQRAARVAALGGLREELRTKGLEKAFGRKLAAAEEGGPESLVQEIRDELRVIDGIAAGTKGN